MNRLSYNSDTYSISITHIILVGVLVEKSDDWFHVIDIYTYGENILMRIQCACRCIYMVEARKCNKFSFNCAIYRSLILLILSTSYMYFKKTQFPLSSFFSSSYCLIMYTFIKALHYRWQSALYIDNFHAVFIAWYTCREYEVSNW